MNTPEQRSAYIISQAVCAMVEAMGMQAQNELRKSKGEEPEYNYTDFEAISLRYGVHHNAVIGYLREV